MSILSPKNRLVSFRLSQQDYEELQALCMAQRARSLSDFVRDSMHRMICGSDAVRSGSHVPDASRVVFEMPAVTFGRSVPTYAARESSLQSISALTDMLLSLHQRTEVLDRQVNRLMLMIRQQALAETEEETIQQGSARPEESESSRAQPSLVPGRE